MGELQALENRGQHCPLAQIRDLEASRPFALLGGDSDHGGEFINHPVLAYLGQRPKPVRLTRARPYQKNDTAPVEQRNGTHVQQPFGYERYAPRRWRRRSTPCAGARWGSCSTTSCRR